MSVTHRRTLALAVPVMLANLSTPLIGIVDTAVIGRLPDPAYIGAIALGALIFTFLFWAFGFLRMGTTGLTAQALGAADDDGIAADLARAVMLAAAIGVLLIAAQWPLRTLAFSLLEAPARVEHLAQGYFDLRIWAAPAALANYALLGWFVGLGRATTALALQLLLNGSNIAFDAVFVLVFEWGVRGVAGGTLLAEYLAAVTGIVLAVRLLLRRGARPARARIFDAARIRRTLAVNRDIMVRSLALILVFAWFMAEGARAGAVILAANAILMHFVSAGAYFLDGLAHAAEALVGRAVGAREHRGLREAVRITSGWAAACAALVGVVLALGGETFIAWMTVDAETRLSAAQYLPWAAAAPLLGVAAFQLDGIFIGATHTAEMRRAMLASLAIFIAAWWLLRPFGNHGLWAALSVHYVARAATLYAYFPALLRRHADPASETPS